jgi:hypothetical protein
VLGHEVAAVVVTEREAAGGAGAETAELLADGYCKRLRRLEAGAVPERVNDNETAGLRD